MQKELSVTEITANLNAFNMLVKHLTEGNRIRVNNPKCVYVDYREYELKLGEGNIYGYRNGTRATTFELRRDGITRHMPLENCEASKYWLEDNLYSLLYIVRTHQQYFQKAIDQRAVYVIDPVGKCVKLVAEQEMELRAQVARFLANQWDHVLFQLGTQFAVDYTAFGLQLVFHQSTDDRPTTMDIRESKTGCVICSVHFRKSEGVFAVSMVQSSHLAYAKQVWGGEDRQALLNMFIALTRQ